MTWDEGARLARELATDPGTRLGAIAHGFSHPLSREAAAMASFVGAKTTDGQRQWWFPEWIDPTPPAVRAAQKQKFRDHWRDRARALGATIPGEE